MQVILETERLFLRKMTMEDFDSLYVVLADSDIMQHYPYASTPVATYAMFCDRQYITNEQMNDKKFLKLVNG